jgi:glycosyltransferase involved in cell wall biosynthesis
MEQPTKQKLLYLITQGEYGGAQHYVLDLAKSFKGEYDVTVAFGEVEKSGKFIELLEQNQISYERLPELKRSLDLKADAKAYFAIRRLITKIDPDIIHLNSSKISILGSLAALGKKCKVVYTAHGWVFNEALTKKEKNQYIWAEKLTASFKDMIITVSEYDRQTALNYRIAPAKKLTVIHNGIPDFPLLQKTLAQNEIRQICGEAHLFEKYDFTIGSIGYLYKNKGFDFLINAVNLLKKDGYNPLLILIGDGPEKEELINWLDQLELKDHVRILGEVKNASRLLSAFDYYVCSSLKEGLSYTIIEAMTAALPIVATNVGGNRELIEDKKDGLIVEPGDANALKKGITYLYSDPDFALKMGASAHKKALDSFEIEQMIYKTRLVYGSLIS